MNDNDELNDSAVLSAVRDSVSGLPLPTAPHLQAIAARGRARRRRRLAGVSLASAGACAALGVALAGGWGSAGPASHQTGPAAHHQTPAVHLAAFTVVANPDGSTTLTLGPGQVINPNAVRRALAEHGIPALVTAGQFCRTADQPPPGVGDVVVIRGPKMRPVGTAGRSPGAGIVIYGSRIPRGVELSIGYRQNSQDREISFTLIVAGEPLSCTSIPDSGPHPND
jgi:hypothetical protein